jgi:NAD(P)-dependent dehydrogenase (short-subunit alcohol dehydrogenase family)
MLSLQGRTILVTGGAGVGVGKGVCDAVAKLGGTLVINDVSPELAERAAHAYPNALALGGNIADPNEIGRMFAMLSSQRIVLDGLVNNAGIGLSQMAHNASEFDYDRLISIDLRGVWLVTRAFTHHVLNTKLQSASIVNISSVHAHSTMARYALYSSAKAGVEGFTRGLAVELGPNNIRCNAVAPGYVHSTQNMDLISTWTDDPQTWVRDHSMNQQALEFQIEPLDCGWAVAFLLSDLARAITGQTLRVDAGMTAMIYNKDFL